MTGASAGIGRATAVLAIAEGARVAMFDIDEAGTRSWLASLSEGAERARFWRMDISTERDVERCVTEAASWLGGLDVLLHIAGIMRGYAVHASELDQDVWDAVVAVNLTGSFLMAKHAARIMRPERRGAIVLTASPAGVTQPSGSVAYGASKGGVHGLTMTLASQLEPDGIRVNDLCPGIVDTPLLRDAVSAGLAAGLPSGELAALVGRALGPEEVARVLVYLASDQAESVRGTVATR